MPNGDEMSDTDSIRQALETQLEELLKRSNTARGSLRADEIDIGDRIDKSIEERRATDQMHAHDRHFADIRAIEAALERIADGEYGECEECGDDIPMARMRAIPTSRYCVECQEDIEQAKPPRYRKRMLEDFE